MAARGRPRKVDNTTQWEEPSWGISRSTIVSGIIAIVVIVGLFALFNALPGGPGPTEPANEQTQEEQEGNASEQEEETKEDENDEDGIQVELPTEYSVQQGDNLWKISERFYGSGFGWTKIMAENKLTDPDELAIGQELNIPKTEIKPQTHTVQRGETLWDISEKYYGSGFTWEIISKANSGKVGQLPGGGPLITPGQQLTIP